MKNCKRLLFALLLLLTVCLCLSSCGEEKIVPANEDEVKAAAERLTKESKTWCDLFFREGGIPIKEGGREKGVYREVDGEKLQKMGFSRISDLKTYEQQVFSPSMCDAMDRVLFSGYVDPDNGLGWVAALIEDTRMDYSTGTAKQAFDCLLVYPEALPLIRGDEVEFDFSTATVKTNRGDRVSLSVTAKGVGESEGKTSETTLDLILIDGVWYLDNYPTVRFLTEE